VRALAALVVLAGVALVACTSGGDGASPTASPATAATGEPRDPSERGPYGVGVTEITFTRASSTTGEPRELRTAIWYPTDDTSATPVANAPPAADGAPFPVVLYSHGNGGHPRGAMYLTQQLASWGFVVAAPPHVGNTSSDCGGQRCDAASTADSARNRVNDITFVLDELLTLQAAGSDPVAAAIDPERAGVAGYSFGGWTAAHAAALEGVFDAGIVQAPGSADELLVDGVVTDVPMMLMAAGKDALIDPDGVRRVYEAYRDDVPHYLVYLPEAIHSAFHDICFEAECESALSRERGHELIKRYATAFLLTYLAGDTRYSALLEQSDPPDAEVTFAGASAAD
jgi:predicted dienelactone hydrolase